MTTTESLQILSHCIGLHGKEFWFLLALIYLAPWLADYLNELAAFPGSKFDDQVDSTTQALEYMICQESHEGSISAVGSVQALHFFDGCLAAERYLLSP